MKIERRKPLRANIGIVGVGHHTYWAQFEGLLHRMHVKQKDFGEKVKIHGVNVFDFGLIDESQSTYKALAEIRKTDLDLVFVDMLTYATSATFAPLIKSLDIPLVMVALQPDMAMDYAHGSTFLQLMNDDFCSMPEFANVAVRMGKNVPEIILGHEQGDPIADAEIKEWCQIAKVLHDLIGDTSFQGCAGSWRDNDMAGS